MIATGTVLSFERRDRFCTAQLPSIPDDLRRGPTRRANIWRALPSWSLQFPSLHQNPVELCPQAKYRFVEHLLSMKHLWSVCQYVKRFRSYALSSYRDRRNFFVFSSPNFFRVGKFSKVRFKSWPNTKLVCKFPDDPFTDGWDPSCRILGPKPIKKGSTAQNIGQSPATARHAAN